MERSRHQYLQLKLVYSTIQDIILDLEVEEEIAREAGTAPSILATASDRVEDIQAFRAVLSRVEAQHYLPCLKMSNLNQKMSDVSENADQLLGMSPTLFSVDCHVRNSD